MFLICIPANNEGEQMHQVASCCNPYWLWLHPQFCGSKRGKVNRTCEQANEPLNIMVAIGGKLHAAGNAKIYNWQWKVIDFIWTCTSFLLKDVNCDVVLGITWLRTLGPIPWDYKELKVQYSDGGKRFTLTGERNGPNRFIDAIT